MDKKEEPKVLVKVSDLRKLLKAELKVDMLEAAGVDNWSGYGEALSGEIIGDKPYWEQCDDIDQLELNIHE